MLGRQGGKIADNYGNYRLILVSSGLLMVAFFSLSTFVGQAAYIIVLILILGNVGQTFMQVAMTKTISQTLQKENTGVGMGLLSMVNFISGAIAMSIIGKLIDQKETTLQFNPLLLNAEAAIFSNIFFCMALLVIVAFVIYKWRFTEKKTI